MTVSTSTVFFRPVWKISMQLAVMDSSTEMQEVSVAKIVVTKKSDADHISGFSHACENFGKGDKHQAGACAHALGSGEHIDSRDDHGAGQKGYAGVKEFQSG